jgi:hypothetical protein
MLEAGLDCRLRWKGEKVRRALGDIGDAGVAGVGGEDGVWIVGRGGVLGRGGSGMLISV